MNNPHEKRFNVWCLSGYLDELDARENDAQIEICAESVSEQKICVYLTPQTAYDFANWLIAAASRIEGRYPEMIEEK